MKYILIFLLLSVGCFSCSSPGTKAPDASAPVTADSGKRTVSAAAPSAFIKLDTLVPFAGVWVNAIYLQRIRNNRSPRLSQNVEESCIKIPSRTLQTASMIYGFHEGSEGMVVIKEGDRYKLYSADLKLLLKTIEPVSDSMIHVGDQTFIRVQHPDTTLYDWGVLEEFLFRGKYRDQLGQAVVFSADGRVSGLDSFRYYIPQPDYIGNPGTTDNIQLGQSPEHVRNFGFRFDKDSLIIYTMGCELYDSVAKECDIEGLGNRLYTLVRMRE